MTSTFGPELDAEIAYRREQLANGAAKRGDGWLPWLLHRRPAHG